MTHSNLELGLGDASDRREEHEERIVREVAVAGPASVRVTNVSGDTRINAGAPGKVIVRIRKFVRGADAEAAKRLLENLEIRIEQAGGAIAIKPHLGEQGRSWRDMFRGRRVAADFDIEVPPDAQIDSQAQSGDIAVRGARGPVSLQNVAGNLAVSDARGALRVRTVSGDIACADYAGRCECTTVSGDVTFKGSRLRGADLQSVSGDIAIDGDLDGAAHRVRTISGDVTLALAGSSYRVDFRSMSGELEAGRRDVSTRREGRHDQVALVGDGAVQIGVKTTSGDLHLDRCAGPVAEADSSPAGEAPREPATDAAREILERLARGEIRVDAAAVMLESLRVIREARKPLAEEQTPTGGGARERTLRIRVTESGTQKVNLAIPLSIARVGKVKLGGLVRGHLAKFGIDLDAVMREVDRTGRIVDIADGAERVEIFVD